jgi:DNA invertase Pin-like site-specific DNA recombinase
MRAVKDAGGRVEFVKDSALNVEGPAQELLLAVLAWVAHWESQHKSDRVKNGLARLRAEGKQGGGSVAFGYKLVQGVKVRDDAALKIVAVVFERSDRGWIPCRR